MAILVIALFCWFALASANTILFPLGLCASPAGEPFGEFMFAVRIAYASPFLVSQITGWALMVGAMMLPLILPALEHIRARSFPERRNRATVLAAVSFALACAAAGTLLPALAAAHMTSGLSLAMFQALLLLAAAAWQNAPARQRALRRCHSGIVLAPTGWTADRSSMYAGLRLARDCLLACAPLMIAAMFGGMNLIAMAALTALAVRERSRGIAGSDGIAAILAAIALLIALKA